MGRLGSCAEVGYPALAVSVGIRDRSSAMSSKASKSFFERTFWRGAEKEVPRIKALLKHCHPPKGSQGVGVFWINRNRFIVTRIF